MTTEAAGHRLSVTGGPEFPDVILHRPGAVTGAVAVPFADDLNGTPLTFAMSGTDRPNMLITGGTGSGLTSTSRAVILGAAYRGIDTRVCSPKRIDVRGLQNWPGVATAGTAPAMTELITKTYDEMLQRYEAMEKGASDGASNQRILLVVDEYLLFSIVINDYWLRIRKTADPEEHPALRQLRNLMILGRAANISAALTTNVTPSRGADPDLLDSFGTRVALGRTTEQQAQALFGDRSAGADIPLGAQGIGIVRTGETITLAKIHWAPDPADYQMLSADHKAALTALLPPRSTWNGPASS